MGSISAVSAPRSRPLIPGGPKKFADRFSNAGCSPWDITHQLRDTSPGAFQRLMEAQKTLAEDKQPGIPKGASGSLVVYPKAADGGAQRGRDGRSAASAAG